jgi:uncharacterized membrane protein
MHNAVLEIVMRYLHIGSAIVVVGGVTFMLACLLPGLRVWDDSFRQSLLTVMQKRFGRLVWLGIAGLIVSGVYNWILLQPLYDKIGPWANALIGTKVLLALVLFTFIGARSLGLVKIKPRAALMIDVHLAAVIILIAGILRYLDLQYLSTHVH